MQTIEELQKEKERLQAELLRVSSEIQERSGHLSSSSSTTRRIPVPTSKSGYLSKWQDRSIGWGGTKWDLRFVRLERGRLSYFKSHDDTAPRYTLTLKNCAVRDDGSKSNKKFRASASYKDATVDNRTPGAFYHVFSIYQRPKPKGAGEKSTAEEDEADDIVPLLRFSTESLAQKSQWMDLLEESCAYCDSDEFNEEENERFFLRQSSSMKIPMDGKPTKGTIPMLYFAPPPTKALSRVPSNVTMPKTRSHVKLNKAKDSAKSNSRRKSDYPPSKPMHRMAEPSYLSDEAPMQNYRGLLNLMLIILVISNFRILLGTMAEYGFVLTHGHFAKAGDKERDLWVEADVPFLCGMVLLNAFVVLAYVVELCTSRNICGEQLGILMHIVNTNAALFIPMTIVWNQVESPINGSILLMSASILWMKLISYVHANSDYRHFPERCDHSSNNFIQHTDEASKALTYPHNITISNIYYFWFAPTLTYQIVYPKLPRRNYQRICTLLLRLFLAFVLMTFLIAQVVRPTLSTMLEKIQDTQDMFSIHIFAEYLLKLGIASTYIWLLVFYGYFHIFLNLLAEVLKFGDRVFYRDWWNSSTISSYWRLWNLPVHYWLVRHLYFPCIRVGVNKAGAMFIVFFFSAVMHEMLISIPFHMIRSYSFLGMMSQIPLVMITKYFDRIRPGSSIGNFTFWLSFCIFGQPMAVILYTIDYAKLKSTDVPSQSLANENVCSGFNCKDEF